ncbi:hypothetical protein DYB36_002508 [Aphanomyces astaci]|uniref:SAM domain-containing protein n=1 Tax=Aphanomyces astaci TaxID=112090 RepID=A0A396ZSP8_APHAT|nr:hypothetical protein DYB36_002508 [Aphanomyces astaci]
MKEKAVPGLFGKAKPLPGQHGYKVKESERLEHEASAMEAQLKHVKMGMAQQQEQRDKDKSKMKGGNRWRSAREDRGSVRQYAQDIKTKTPSTKSKKKKKGESYASVSRPNVGDWGVPQVTEWLASIHLGHHATTFEFNEVSGSVLLDLTPADLDYLHVTDPSDRKLLLQHIEQLKRSSGTASPSSQHRHIQSPALAAPQREVLDDKLHDAPVVLQSKKVAHWSQLTPLADTGVANPSGDVPVNLADGDFNEDDSHASFMKALLDWRATDQQNADEQGKDDTGFWTNPLAECSEPLSVQGGELLGGHFDEEQSHANFLAALQAWRGNSTQQQHERPEQATASTGSPVEAKASCWQCYRLYKAGSVVQDAMSKHSFCSRVCLSNYHSEYARFYTPPSTTKTT